MSCALLVDISVGLAYQSHMFDYWRPKEIWAYDGTPFGKYWRLPKSNGMVLKGFPIIKQNISARVFDAVIHLKTLEALGLGNHRLNTKQNGFFKLSLL